jgi:hypothetical protein
MEIKKLFGQFTLLAALALILYAAANIGLSYRAKSAVKLEEIWQLDIQNLTANHKLPSYWNEIRFIEKIAAQGDSTAETWAKTVSSPIEINPNGNYKLEILFLSQEEDGKKRAVIQHHMIHIPSGNSVWELGRTYELN